MQRNTKKKKIFEKILRNVYRILKIGENSVSQKKREGGLTKMPTLVSANMWITFNPSGSERIIKIKTKNYFTMQSNE